MYKEWCWYSLAWFYCNREDIKKAANIADEESSLSALGISEWNYHFRWVDFGLGEKSHLLVIDPLYKSTAVDQVKEFSENEVKEIIRKFHLFHDVVSKTSITGKGDVPSMQRMSLARLPFFKADSIDALNR